MMKRLEQLADWCEGYLAFVLALAATVKQDYLYAGRPELERLAHARGGQVDTILTVVMVGVVAVVGVLVYTEVESAMTLNASRGRNDPANATRLENASGEVGSGFGDAIELVPIVLIILVAALVIGVIQRFR